MLTLHVQLLHMCLCSITKYIPATWFSKTKIGGGTYLKIIIDVSKAGLMLTLSHFYILFLAVLTLLNVLKKILANGFCR